jgi:hypothetical protein
MRRYAGCRKADGDLAGELLRQYAPQCRVLGERGAREELLRRLAYAVGSDPQDARDVCVEALRSSEYGPGFDGLRDSLGVRR